MILKVDVYLAHVRIVIIQIFVCKPNGMHDDLYINEDEMNKTQNHIRAL